LVAMVFLTREHSPIHPDRSVGARSLTNLV
jgi:hypothetical protein